MEEKWLLLIFSFVAKVGCQSETKEGLFHITGPLGINPYADFDTDGQIIPKGYR